MIAYLEGQIIKKKNNHIILKCSSIGYKIYVIPTQSFIEEDILSLYIYEHITEDKDDLYGFKSYDELEIFETLIGVSGLGPKIALTILASMSKKEIEQAIDREEVKTFQRIKGIGQKMAAKIILELKSKINFSKISQSQNSRDRDSETADALYSLGYKTKEVDKILSQIPSHIADLESKIKWALQNNR